MKSYVLAAALMTSSAADAHPAPFPHTHPPAQYWEQRERMPRERIHGYVGLGGFPLRGVAHDLGGSASAPRWGGGGSIFGGVRLAPVAALDLTYTASGLDTRTETLRLQTFELGLQLHVPLLYTRWDPFLRLGIGTGVLSDSGGTIAVGDAFSAAIGSDVWFRRHWTFGARVFYRSVLVGDMEREGGTALVGLEITLSYRL